MTNATNYSYRIERIMPESGSMMVWYTSETGESKLQEVRLPQANQAVEDVIADACPFHPHIAAAMASLKLPEIPPIGTTGTFTINSSGSLIRPITIESAVVSNPPVALTPEEIQKLISGI